LKDPTPEDFGWLLHLGEWDRNQVKLYGEVALAAEEERVEQLSVGKKPGANVSGAGFYLIAKALSALSLEELPYGTVNKPAPVTLRRHAIEDHYSFVRQNDVDAFAHGIYRRTPILFILHTRPVYPIHFSDHGEPVNEACLVPCERESYCKTKIFHIGNRGVSLRSRFICRTTFVS
jgi:hypothetical protein